VIGGTLSCVREVFACPVPLSITASETTGVVPHERGVAPRQRQILWPLVTLEGAGHFLQGRERGEDNLL